MTADRPIRTRPGAPVPRDPARFNAAAPAGSYVGAVLGAACGNCALAKTYRGPVTGKEWRCGPAVDAAAAENRRLPGTVSPKRAACRRYQPKAR